MIKPRPIKATIFILGSSGLAKEVKQYIGGLNQIRGDSPIHFVEPTIEAFKDYHHKISSMAGTPYCSILASDDLEERSIFVKHIVEPFMSFIHPASKCFNDDIGNGSIVLPGAVLAPGSKLGNHVICYYNSTIGRGARLGNLSIIGPNVSVGENVKIGERVYVGAGAVIKNNVSIGDDVIVHDGAVIKEDTT
jgi:UDP-3-O-[3-hydroxymyristoyl] glucosamine N-acyltransferase